MGSNNQYEHQSAWNSIEQSKIENYKVLYDILYKRIEDKLAEVWKNQNPNKSYLPKEYTNGK